MGRNRPHPTLCAGPTSLPSCLATSRGHHRRGRHQARPPRQSLPGQSRTKGTDGGLRRREGPRLARPAGCGSLPASLLPLLLSPSQSRHSAPPPPTLLSTSHQLRQTRGPQVYPQTLPWTASPSAYRPVRQPLLWAPHQNDPSPAARPLHVLVPLPRTAFTQLFTCLATLGLSFRILLLGDTFADQPTPRPERSGSHLTPVPSVRTLGTIISSLFVHVTNSISLYKLCEGRVASVLLATKPVAHSRRLVNIWWTNVGKAGKHLDLLLQDSRPLALPPSVWRGL